MKYTRFCLYGLAVLIIGALAYAISTDYPRNSLKEEQQVDLNERYRNMVHSKFQRQASVRNADTRYLIIVDYSIPSNHERLFVWDNECDGIVEKFWCAHGLGGNSTAERPEFSNLPGSNCSSLGWYLIDRSVGVSVHYGYKYHAVDGLDSSNSNARRREILIHPWHSVSNDEAAQIDHPMNLDYRCAGCFTISDIAFQTIDRYIRSTNSRILLYAINGVD